MERLCSLLIKSIFYFAGERAMDDLMSLLEAHPALGDLLTIWIWQKQTQVQYRVKEIACSAVAEHKNSQAAKVQ